MNYGRRELAYRQICENDTWDEFIVSGLESLGKKNYVAFRTDLEFQLKWVQSGANQEYQPASKVKFVLFNDATGTH